MYIVHTYYTRCILYIVQNGDVVYTLPSHQFIVWCNSTESTNYNYVCYVPIVVESFKGQIFSRKMVGNDSASYHQTPKQAFYILLSILVKIIFLGQILGCIYAQYSSRGQMIKPQVCMYVYMCQAAKANHMPTTG